MIKNLLDLEKSSIFIITAVLAVILISCFNTPMLLHIELENIFGSFLINDVTNNIISVNLEATSIPPLFFWIKHIFINIFGFNLSMIKLIPALAMCAIILLTYTFILKQTLSKTFATIASLVLATSPFFITASKLVSLDLIYICIYITTTFIFTSNVYSNKASNMYSFIAGILIACCFSLTGFIGTLPILVNLIIINFIRGGFLLNFKFNNPIFILLGFLSFIILWVVSLGKIVGLDDAIDLVFNYQFLESAADIKFDEGKIFKYITLFIIGGFPWISLLPSAFWNTIRNLPNRLNTSNLQTSLPLVCLVNSIMLSIYYASVETEFYILLTIYFNFAIMVADRIHNIEINKISIINIFFICYSIAIMMLFLNEFLNINLIQYSFDTTVKELLIDEKTSISGVSNNVFYLMAISYFIGATSLFAYGISKKQQLLSISFITAIINLVIFVFIVFPNLKNEELNNSRSMNSWLSYTIEDNTDTIAFYKLKDPTIASKANNSFYFNDIIKLKSFIDNQNNENIYVFFNKQDRHPINRINKRVNTQCRNNICFLKI